jgi:transcriptional regulator of arginine metabolism
MQKSKRQEIILDLIEKVRPANQAELVAHLLKMGVEATQASISRDLGELGVIKINGRYRRPFPSNGATGISPTAVEPAGGALVVVKCASGLASAIAVQIDSAAINGLVGTIAGDDTVFAAVSGEEARSRVIKQIWQVFEKGA